MRYLLQSIIETLLSRGQRSLLSKISNKKLRQKDIAQAYRIAMQSDVEIDWGKVNTAIMERWSRSGLKRIKQLAWSEKCFDPLDITYRRENE